MKTTLIFLFASLSASLAGAQEIGQRLSAQQMVELPVKATIQLGSQTLKVLPAASATEAQRQTRVVNAQGLVGASPHRVLVSNVSATEIKKALADSQLPPVVESSMTDTLGLASLRFADLRAAVQARERLSQLLPKAQVTVPIHYALPQPR